MSDTPETDAVIKNVGDGPYIAYLVHFARKLERERDAARRERDEAISKLKFAQNELFTILRFQEDEKREHRNLLERLSFFQNRFESMRAERDQAMSDLEELREELKEEAK